MDVSDTFDPCFYEFGDKRRTERFKKIVEAFIAHPGASIPQACKSASTSKAAYRFIESKAVSTEKIDQGTERTTLSRILSLDIVLVPQDTTYYNYDTLKHTTGLGPIDSRKTRGMLMHSGYAVRPDGHPLGLLYRNEWTRDEKEFGKKEHRRKKTTEEKESQRWIDCEAAVESCVPSSVHIVFLCDREGDFYDHLGRTRPPNSDIIVRVAQNRLVEDKVVRTLFDKLETSTPCGTYEVTTTDPQSGKPRRAVVTYRYTEVELLPPKGRLIAENHAVRAWAIMAREENPPEGTRGLDWKLLTTIEITNDEMALQMIRWYCLRWIIERFHYVMKSGCHVEELQLKTVDRLDKTLALFAVIASRILYMTYYARKDPNESASAILTAIEWKALHCAVHKTGTPPTAPPTVLEAVRMIGQLGGFMGRKRDGMPGVKVLWRGMQKLSVFAEAYELFVNIERKKDVGKD